MQVAPPTPNEAERLQRLRRFGVLDTLPQEAFDHITALASAICDTPIALISLVDQDRQWFKSRVGLDATQTSREVAFCAHAIHEPEAVMVVEDATKDPRFQDNPLVTGQPDIRFYAGAPIVTGEGHALGTVCVIDPRSRSLSPAQQTALRSLARLVLTLMTHEEEQRALMAERERAAARASEIQTALTAAGLDLLSFVDTHYVYRYVNRCYTDYWARPEADIVGHPIAHVMGQSVFSTLVKPRFDRALAGEEVTYEATIDFPGKGQRPVEVSYLPVVASDGTVQGVVVRSHDIYALRQREARLQTTVDELEHKTLEQQRFIHIVSHDLREPINTICNFASLLAEDEQLQASPTAPRYLDYVVSGGQRIKVLLEDLINFLQLDQHAVAMTEVDLSRVVHDVRDDLQSAMAQTGASLHIGPLHAVQGDASLLRILLQNLLANAIKFCPRDRAPVVTIDAMRASDGSTRLRVTDNGIGIAPAQTERIFEIFTRLHNKREFAGSGLGLSICRRIADLHGGRINVRSQPGEGSCFELELPATTTTTDQQGSHTA